MAIVQLLFYGSIITMLAVMALAVVTIGSLIVNAIKGNK